MIMADAEGLESPCLPGLLHPVHTDMHLHLSAIKFKILIRVTVIPREAKKLHSLIFATALSELDLLR